jgi:mercuric ion transport protein
MFTWNMFFIFIEDFNLNIKYIDMKKIILFAIIVSFVACTQNKRPNNTNIDLKGLVTTNFHVNGMTCTGCEKTITMGVKSIDGVKDVMASYSDSLTIVTYDSSLVTPALISQKINDIGYQVISSSPHGKMK